jgi:hypothetical protein
MALDFILGETGHNWSRGYSVLLPKTSDSTSMGDDGQADPKRPGEEQAYWAKLQRDMENIRLNVWRGPYPMMLDSASVVEMLSRPGEVDEQRAIKRAGFSRLLNSGKVILSDGGRRVKFSDTHAKIVSSPSRSDSSGTNDDDTAHKTIQEKIILPRAQILPPELIEKIRQEQNTRLQDNLLKTRSPMQGEYFNDDELAVARDGGSSERAALSRARGWSSIGSRPAVARATYALVSRKQAAQPPAQDAADASSPGSPGGSPGGSPSKDSDDPAPDKDNAPDKPDDGAPDKSDDLIIGGASPSQLAAQQRDIARRNLATRRAIAQANAAQAAVATRRRLPPPPAPPPVDPNLDPNSPTSYTPIYPYQTSPLDAYSSGGHKDELALARDGGSSERAALSRTRGWGKS